MTRFVTFSVAGAGLIYNRKKYSNQRVQKGLILARVCSHMDD